MADEVMLGFTYKEVAEALIKQKGIHDGIWGVFVRFGMTAMNTGTKDGDLLPTALLPVIEIGLTPFKTETNLSVDAAKVNPQPDPVRRRVRLSDVGMLKPPRKK